MPQGFSAPPFGPENIEFQGWEDDDKPIFVQMQLDLIERIQREISQGLALLIPSDISGLLVGRMSAEREKHLIIVDDYELVRYTGEDDTPRFARDDRLAERVRHWGRKKGPQEVVGFFRSRRGGWATFDAEDVRDAKRLLPNKRNIFLLIRATKGGESNAMVFLRRSKSRELEKQYGEFPFDAGLLLAQLQRASQAPAAAEPSRSSPLSPPSTPRNAVVPEETPAQVQSLSPAEEVPEPRPSFQEWKERWENRWASLCVRFRTGYQARFKAGFTFQYQAFREILARRIQQNPLRSVSFRPPRWVALVPTGALAIATTMLCMDNRVGFQPKPPALETRPVVLSNPVNLRVRRDGDLLEVNWNGASPEIMNSFGGVITIRAGNRLKALQLDASEMRTGRIYLQTRSQDLGIRLEITTGDGTRPTESVRVVGPPA